MSDDSDAAELGAENARLRAPKTRTYPNMR